VGVNLSETGFELLSLEMFLILNVPVPELKGVTIRLVAFLVCNY